MWSFWTTVPEITLYQKKKKVGGKDWLTWFLEKLITKAIFPRSTTESFMVRGGSGVSMIYWCPYWSTSNGGWSCLQDAEWLLSTNSSWWAGVEKWHRKLCRMANQYCSYAQWGDSIAHLPEQQGFHRYIPVDFWGKIMNISLFRATKTERSIVMVENSVSWKRL